ncbi:MAG: four helix bundle protein [Candidatus Peribacter sp.]|nr:four helix bundle protein [Candidatus Peribacter sp.]
MLRKYDKGFRKLIIWQEARRLMLKIYKLSGLLPKEEQFNLISQLRRAATSVGANIAEGSAMQTSAHREVYFMRARGSVAELDCLVELCHDLGFISDTIAADAIDHCSRQSYLLTSTLRAMRQRSH